MPKPYFRQIPNFEYVNRLPGSGISEYIDVKNLFKRVKLRDDIFQNLSFFDKYQIIGDERPDNIAYKIYDDDTLDWIVLLSNNILNIQTEWPLPQNIFDKILLEKYVTYEKLYSEVHHYESIEVKDSSQQTIIPKGLIVPEKYSITFFDYRLGIEVTKTQITNQIMNYDYEIKLEDAKRNIYLLKPRYLNIIYNDIENIMEYKKGGTQFISSTLKKGDNIKLYL